MKDLRRVGVVSGFHHLMCHLSLATATPPPPTEADGGPMRVGLPGSRPPLALHSFFSGYTFTPATNRLCCIDFAGMFSFCFNKAS